MRSIPKHEFFGKKIDIRACLPTCPASQGENTKFKVWVGDLDDSINEEMLKGTLSAYGTVAKVKILRNPDGHVRGYAFVFFTEQAPVDMLIKTQYLAVNGKRLSFKPDTSRTKEY